MSITVDEVYESGSYLTYINVRAVESMDDVKVTDPQVSPFMSTVYVCAVIDQLSVSGSQRYLAKVEPPYFL